MASEKESLEFSSSVAPNAAADYLEALARGLREGRVLIESGDRSLNLEVGSDVNIDFEAKASPEKGKSSIEIELSWQAKQPAKEAPPSLFIGAGEHHDEPHDDQYRGSGELVHQD